MSDYQVVLLGNFAPARQQSMLRFAELLRSGFARRGVRVFLVQPEPRLHNRASARLRKWAAYLDQYVRFPPRAGALAAAAGWDADRPTVFHICDHSNSPYLRSLRGRRVALTCHDLLAVRGARGEPVRCPASPTGKILQRIILHYLRRASWVGCDSTATRDDFLRLTGRTGDARVEVIPLSLNAPFSPVSLGKRAARLARWPRLRETPYILHVGSGLERKNRAGVLRALALARKDWNGAAVFAGEALHEGERAVARELGLSADALVEAVEPGHDELVALYSGAHAFVFPSFTEGYGWPVLEAQACGCPVICSNTTSLPEIAGTGAILCAPDDAMAFAQGIVALAQPEARAALVSAGFANAAHFTEDSMLDAYSRLHQRALEGPPLS